MITAVILDMDDTLYDEVDYCRSGFRAVSTFIGEKYNTQPDKVFDALWAEFTSGNHTRTFNAALDRVGVDYNIEDIKYLVDFYRKHKPDIKLPAESKVFIEKLAEKFRLALLTDGFLPAQRYKVEALGIANYFEFIVYTEELGREFWKPHTRGFEIILEKLDVNAENTVYIADNARKDFIGPNKLGMKTIQFKRPNKVHLSPPPDESARPDHIANSMNDISVILKKIC